MRCFAVARPEGYGSLRGGLARFATANTAGGESIASGQGSKDVWVLARGPVPKVSLLPSPAEPVSLLDVLPTMLAATGLPAASDTDAAKMSNSPKLEATPR